MKSISKKPITWTVLIAFCAMIMDFPVPVKFIPQHQAFAEETQDSVKALAEAQDFSPLAIYNDVMGSFQAQLFWGIRKNPQQVIASGSGSSAELAWLMFELLKASGYQVRYATGQAALNVDTAKKVFGYANEEDLVSALESARLYVSTDIDTSGRKNIVFRHAWVRAYLPYHPYGGASESFASTWIDLDPSLKMPLSANDDAMDYLALSGTDPSKVLEEMRAYWSINPSLPSALCNNPSGLMEIYQNTVSKLKLYFNQQGDKVSDLLSSVSISSFSRIPAAPIFQQVTVPQLSTIVPEMLLTRIRVVLEEPQMSKSISISSRCIDVIGGQISINFVPASLADTDLLETLYEEDKIHADSLRMRPVLHTPEEEEIGDFSLSPGAALTLSVMIEDDEGLIRAYRDTVPAVGSHLVYIGSGLA
ncbi:MAG: transglutaminase domain-containing protein, partial [Chlamydiota bacterium]|nr:transglutaminase domain-containing protein [Chlamydiota bacterium]